MVGALGALVILFMVMSVISVIGVLLMFLSKNEMLVKGTFYFLCIWGMLIAGLNVYGITEEWVGEILLACAVGGLSVIALLIQLCLKTEKKFMIAKILVAVSVIAGVIDCFLF